MTRHLRIYDPTPVKHCGCLAHATTTPARFRRKQKGRLRYSGTESVPGGGGRAWPGFEIDHSEPQARVWRSRGRAAAHGHLDNR